MFLRLLTFCMCVLTPRERTQGKDETFLCSLSTFDAYFVTRPHKSPKPFVFAVKSMDDLSFFENTADYLHVFSCGQKEGEKWVSQKKNPFQEKSSSLLFSDPTDSSGPC